MYIRGQNGLTDTFKQSLQGKPGVSLITNGTRILLNKGDTKTYTILPQAKTNDEIENFGIRDYLVLLKQKQRLQ